MSEQHEPQEQDAALLPAQPGHVMAREHYERLAREAAEQK